MTAIAAVVAGGLVYMGGDSAAVEQSHYLDLTATPKVFAVGPMVIGYTSSFRMGHALQHRLTLPAGLPEVGDLTALDRWMAVDFVDAVRQVMRDVGYMKKESEREQGGIFLCGVQGQLYQFDDDFHARRQTVPYAAAGSGLSACLGALWLAHRRGLFENPAEIVKDALAAAEACIATVRGPFHVVVGGNSS
ncbi:hypothetical protein [Tsuneonella sp. HG222]